jgi:hypothetical protein
MNSIQETVGTYFHHQWRKLHNCYAGMVDAPEYFFKIKLFTSPLVLELVEIKKTRFMHKSDARNCKVVFLLLVKKKIQKCQHLVF